MKDAVQSEEDLSGPKHDPELPEKPTNFLETFMHLLKGNIGVGLFAMGDAFKNGGLYVASTLTIFMAIVCIHCQHLLLNSAHKASLLHYGGEKRLDYAKTVELCFAEGPKRLAATSVKMGILCNYFINITQLGFCCIYLTFIAANLVQILEVNNVYIDIHLVILIIWVPIWITCLITRLKALVPISLVANLLIIASFIISMYFALKDSFPNLKERRLHTDIRKTALSFGTIIFSYEGIALVLPIKNEMKHPENFGKCFGVLNLGMILIVLMYTMSGLFGYLRWGEEVEGTVTANLGNSILAQCTKVMVSLGILLTYPLQFFVPVDTMAPKIIKSRKCVKKPLICMLIFRSLLALGTLIVAEAFPNVGIFISLIGGLCSTVLALVFPPILEVLLLKHNKKQSKWFIAAIGLKNTIIIIVAFFSFTVGTYVSVEEIVKYFKKLIEKKS